MSASDPSRAGFPATTPLGASALRAGREEGPNPQARRDPRARHAVVLRGIGFDGKPDWIFAPVGWDVRALLRQFDFSGGPATQLRTAVIRPSQLRALVTQYGQTPAVKVSGDLQLASLMQRDLLAVELLVARVQAASSDMPL